MYNEEIAFHTKKNKKNSIDQQRRISMNIYNIQCLCLQVFTKLKQQDKEEKFRHKIVPIEGDCSLPGLGMTEFDRQKLIENCQIILHVAATVRFDEKLKLALAINVNGTKEIMLLSKKMENLVVRIYQLNDNNIYYNSY